MMIRLNAATRLKAHANEEQARRYIKHVAGIDVGQKTYDEQDRIAFSITYQQYGEAKKKLDQTLKRGHLTRSSSAYPYYADDTMTRLVVLNAGIGSNGWVGNIALVDKNHYEDYLQRVNRLLGL